jgi:uncharacterized protein YrrD
MLVAVLTATGAQAQHQELIGLPVYAADGAEVGRVADVASTGNEIDALRVSRGAPMGFGERLILIPQPAFMIRRGRIILPDLRAADVDQFPDASSLGKDETDGR